MQNVSFANREQHRVQLSSVRNSSLCLTGLSKTITAFMEGDSCIADAILDSYWRVSQYLPRECSSDDDMITVSLLPPEVSFC